MHSFFYIYFVYAIYHAMPIHILYCIYMQNTPFPTQNNPPIPPIPFPNRQPVQMNIPTHSQALIPLYEDCNQLAFKISRIPQRDSGFRLNSLSTISIPPSQTPPPRINFPSASPFPATNPLLPTLISRAISCSVTDLVRRSRARRYHFHCPTAILWATFPGLRASGGGSKGRRDSRRQYKITPNAQASVALPS